MWNFFDGWNDTAKRRRKFILCVFAFAVIASLLLCHALSNTSKPVEFNVTTNRLESQPISEDTNKSISAEHDPKHEEVTAKSSISYETTTEKISIIKLANHSKYISPSFSTAPTAENHVDQLLVHLDLKGAPPKLQFLEWFIKTCAKLGATGLLIEWEDKFPYTGLLAPVVAENAYSLKEVQKILHIARENSLMVMPLVQTFGHMEFVLKIPQFRHLREDPRTPQALCPSLNESRKLVETMLDQIMEIHSDSAYVHIGSDEVFVLGKCARCRKRYRDHIILEHVTHTAIYLKDTYGVRTVMWEDMLRNLNSHSMQRYQVSQLIEPMFWWYTPNVRRYVAPDVWRRAERVYQWVWGAGAFKGAFGSYLFVAPVDRHVQNNLEWLDLLSEENGRMRSEGGVRGLVLTGWQRYDHFSTLCELLPAALPSLVFSIAALRYNQLGKNAIAVSKKALGCEQSGWLHSSNDLDMPYLYNFLWSCNFPGHDFYMFLKRYNYTIKEVETHFNGLEKKQMSSWLGSYNFRHNFSSILKISEEKRGLDSVKKMLFKIMPMAYRSIIQVYDQDTALEWIEDKIYSHLRKIDSWILQLEKMENIDIFPVRPIKKYPDALLKYMNKYVRNWKRIK